MSDGAEDFSVAECASIPGTDRERPEIIAADFARTTSLALKRKKTRVSRPSPGRAQVQ